MKYSTREKLGHFNKLRAASHLEADLKLLEKLDPKNSLLAKYPGNDEKYQQDILYVLLDLTTACDIKDFRREYHKEVDWQKKWEEYVEFYNRKLGLVKEKYGEDYIIQNNEEVKDILFQLNIPYSPLKCDVLIGLSLLDISFLNPIPFEPRLSEDDLIKAIDSVFDEISAKKTHPKLSESQDSEQKVPGTKVSDYKTAYNESKTEELEDKEAELDEKEEELNSRESDLDEKESELEEKEQELTEKEEELEKKAAVTEKKSASKKQNIQK
ncbi:hypothetical protein E2605_11785 [Dysgonomonas capnocytophagoides]|uniref:Uncharacterized protein n=1 Tax=Dysgonomonas capnocytophagoides TaxID=45254 RepID=A0A4Y8KZT2_9BACT|nr:hypothetical protein [Dysgonomonas capnocytophagoides]TFD95521.1 hypothetical protein E2605_11785 [Dysgonomonas capnocytophagoides]